MSPDMSGSQQQPGHERCGTPGRGTGKPCGLPAGWGTSHPGTGRCRKHLGNSPSHVAAAVEQQAREAAAEFGLPIHTTAAQALQDELARSNGLVAFYRAQIMELDPKAFTYGVTSRTVRQKPGRGGQVGQEVEVVQRAGIHPLLRLYDGERKHLAEVAARMEAIGIGKRLAEVEEQQVAILKRIMQAAMADPEAGLSAEQQARVLALVPRHARALTAVPGG